MKMTSNPRVAGTLEGHSPTQELILMEISKKRKEMKASLEFLLKSEEIKSLINNPSESAENHKRGAFYSR